MFVGDADRAGGDFSASGDLDSFGDERSGADGLEVGHIRIQPDGDLARRVAGRREGQIGEGEQCPALHGADAVEMPLLHLHFGQGVAGPDLDKLDAVGGGEAVVLKWSFTLSIAELLRSRAMAADTARRGGVGGRLMAMPTV